MYRADWLAGVDEVGRGPLAGAVVAAAVVLNPLQPIPGLKDSKALSEKKREQLDIEIRQHAVAFCIARAEPEEIDRLNILQASFVAMQRAVAGLGVAPHFVLVDGNQTPGFDCPSDFLIKGDTKHDAIKAASIIAKVARDREMRQLHDQYPEYGLDRHKGYPTKAHLDALRRFGPSEIHRMSFAPCRDAVRASTRGDQTR